jgi:hypothetical protein
LKPLFKHTGQFFKSFWVFNLIKIKTFITYFEIYDKNLFFVRDIFIFDGGNKRLRNVTNVYCQCQISRTFVISTEMQQIGNKKVIHRGTRDIICNTFDYMRITFPKN